MSCPLCEAKKITPWLHEDEKVYICYCSSHPSKVMIVLKRHTTHPTQEELGYIKKLCLKFFPEKHFRDPASLRDHWHLHEV